MFEQKPNGAASNFQKQAIELLAPTQPNPTHKFSKISGESDFHLMVSQD